MRILLGHCRYRQPGGEDEVFAAEADLLERRAHQVCRYVVSNQQLDRHGALHAAGTAVWNRDAHRRLRALIRERKSQIAHFHNTFALLSPAVYYAAKAEGAAVIQTVHNYRLLCPGAVFFRKQRVCEDCSGKAIPWRGVLHACYRESRAASAATAAMLAVHRLMGTWSAMVDIYVALTDFARTKLIEGGLPAGKIVVKPNFVHPDPGFTVAPGEQVLFVGRLVPEKGLPTLLSAWQRLGRSATLRIVGEGPLAPLAVEAACRLGNVEYLGWQPRDRVLALMREARVLVFPSEWHETFGMVGAEAFAVGLPVIASNLGSLSTLIEDRRTGLHFRPGDPEDLAARLDWALSHPAELDEIRRRARAEYEAKYTAERNYETVMEIYEKAIRAS